MTLLLSKKGLKIQHACIADMDMFSLISAHACLAKKKDGICHELSAHFVALCSVYSVYRARGNIDVKKL